MKHRVPSLAVLLVILPFCAPEVRAQRADPRAIEVGNVNVRVRSANGAPLGGSAIVKLSALVSTLLMTESTQDSSQATFRGLPLGEYQIEVSAAGYVTAHENVWVIAPGANMQVYVQLQPEGLAINPVSSGGPPAIAPKAQNELDKAREALNANNLTEAQAHLEKAIKLAPNHPEAYYMLGVLYLRKNELALARSNLEKAISLYPDHAPALGALGRLNYKQSDFPATIRALEKAILLDAKAWQDHTILASAYYQQNEWGKARFYAERALELANGKGQEIRIVLAQSLIKLGEKEKAEKELETFVTGNANHPNAPVARKLMEEIRRDRQKREESARIQAEPSAPSIPAEKPAAAPGILVAPQPELKLPDRSWSPPDVDETAPVVARDVTCALPDLLKGAGRRVVNLAENLQDITARERVEHSELDSAGRLRASQARTFDYMVSIRKVGEKLLSVEEYRDGGAALASFPTNLVTTGQAAFALVFHPFYAQDFEMRCEGLGQWKDQPVWYVHFQQREDRPRRVRVYQTKEGRFPIALKGRAWIAANSHEILRLETDLIKPVEEIRLKHEHLVIEYAPVTFAKRNVRLWLPLTADLYADFRGKRYHHRHSFSNFTYFTVDTKQKVFDPKVPDQEKPPQDPQRP